MAAIVLLLLGARRYSRKQRQGLARSAIGRYWCCSSTNSGYTEQRVQWYMAAAREADSDMRQGPSVRNLETEQCKGIMRCFTYFMFLKKGVLHTCAYRPVTPLYNTKERSGAFVVKLVIPCLRAEIRRMRLVAVVLH